MNISKKQAIGKYKRATIITELEADFGVIRATEQKIKKALPHYEEVGGLFFTLQTHYQHPTFSGIVYYDAFAIPQPQPAFFTFYNGVWTVDAVGAYESRIDEMLKILIDTFGGERG
jgi:hypothetical protein